MGDYHCPTCFELYATSGTLQRHIKTVHRAIKAVPCPHCEAHFRDRYCLRKHLPMHDGDHEVELKKRAVEWEDGAKSALGVLVGGRGELENIGGMVKSELQGEKPEEPDMLEEVIEDTMQEGSMDPASDHESLDNDPGMDDFKEVKPHRPGPKPSAPALRKRLFEFSPKANQPFQCFLCESRFDLGQFQSHVKKHIGEVKGIRTQLIGLLKEYSTAAARMNATVSSIISQEESG